MRMKYRPVLFFGTSRFFTLIELIVAVSIVSVISSITLAGFQTARSKTIDSRTKEAVSSIRNQAAIYLSTNDTYGIQATSTGIANCRNGIFGDARIQKSLASCESLSGGQVSCLSTGAFYSLSVPLKSDPTKSWCVDSLGGSRVISGTIATEPCTISVASSSDSGVRCPAMGGCVEALEGSSCTSYSTSTSLLCSSVAQTSTCTNGSWDNIPHPYSSCSQLVIHSCTAPDNTVVAGGGTWSGYSTSSVACGSSCSAKNTTITCNNGSWSGAAYNTCTVDACVSCPASGGCGLTAHGDTCTSYTSPSVTSPSTCSSVAVTSTCNNGSWSTPPGADASCVVSMRSCTAPDSSIIANGGTWYGYSVSSTACGSSCPSKNTVITCNDGSWSGGTVYNTCTVNTCVSCPASGGCGVTAHGGSCTTYSSQNPSGLSCATVSRSSTCNNGSWDVTPHAYSSCSSGCAASGACSAVTNGASCTSYTSGSVTSPTTCASVARTSTCNNGSWSVAPGTYSGCGLGCSASGGCSATPHGGTCVSYYESAPAATTCTSRTSTCSNGSWSPSTYLYSSCIPGCAGTPACGGSYASRNGDVCIAFTVHDTYSPDYCGAHKINSTCSNQTWSPTPATYGSCIGH